MIKAYLIGGNVAGRTILVEEDAHMIPIGHIRFIKNSTKAIDGSLLFKCLPQDEGKFNCQCINNLHCDYCGGEGFYFESAEAENKSKAIEIEKQKQRTDNINQLTLELA